MNEERRKSSGLEVTALEIGRDHDLDGIMIVGFDESGVSMGLHCKDLRALREALCIAIHRTLQIEFESDDSCLKLVEAETNRDLN